MSSKAWEFHSGLACQCECIGCGERLEAKKGPRNTHHFAHHRKDVNDDTVCPFSFDRCIFWMCRKVLSEHNELTTPTYNAHFYHRLIPSGQDYQISKPQKISYETVSFPIDLEGSYSSDIAILNVKDHQLALKLDLGRGVEFKNQWDYRRPYEYKGNEIALIEIKLRLFKDEFKKIRTNFKQAIESLLISSMDSKTWLYHPREDTFRAEFQEQINEAKVVESNLKESQARVERELSEQRNIIALRKKQVASYTPEQYKERLDLLIEQAKLFFNEETKNANLCRECFFISNVEAESCEHCEAKAFQEVKLDADYFYCINKKYDQKGFVRTSLTYFPQLKAKD